MAIEIESFIRAAGFALSIGGGSYAVVAEGCTLARGGTGVFTITLDNELDVNRRGELVTPMQDAQSGFISANVNAVGRTATAIPVVFADTATAATPTDPGGFTWQVFLGNVETPVVFLGI